MALANRRTTLLLVGIAVVFTIVLIILCLTPPSRRTRDTAHHQSFEQGKSHSTTPRGIIIETDPTTTPDDSTTTVMTTKTSTTGTSTTQSSTTETSTTEPEFPDVFGSKSTTEDYIDYNDTRFEETQSTTQSQSDKTTSAATNTETIYAYNHTSTSTESFNETYDEEYTDSTTESSVLSRKHTDSDNETTTVSDMPDANTTLSDTTSTTLQERSETTLADTTTGDPTLSDTTTDESVLSDATTDEPTPLDTTTDEPLPSDTTTNEPILSDTTSDEPILSDSTTNEPILSDTTTEPVTYAETTTAEDIPSETTTEENIPSETTTEEDIPSETTTEEDIPSETTTEEEVLKNYTTEAETTTVEETSPTDETTLEETTPTSTTIETPTTTTSLTTVNETAAECSHPNCKELAARMLDMMDHRASPCKDFYQYACGGVEDDPFLHPEDPNKDVNYRILQTLQSHSNNSIGAAEPAREYFNSCVNKPPVPTEEDLSLLRDLVSRHGQLDPRAVNGDRVKYAFIDEDAFDLQKMLADFIKHDFAPFFEVGLDVDRTDLNRFSVRLSLPLNGYDSGFSEAIDTSYCKGLYEQTVKEALQEAKNLDVTLEYEKLHACREKGDGHGAMIMRLKLATKALNLTAHVDEAKLANKLLDETVFNADVFIEEIKENWPGFHDLRHQLINKNYTEYRVTDLDSRDILTNQVKWGELLQSIVGRPVDKVQVYHEHELMGVLKRMSEERPDNLRNMLLILWASRLYTDLVSPASSSPNSAEYCASVTQYLAPDMAALIYLESFPEEDLDLMKATVDGVVNSVKNTVTAALKLNPGVSRELLDKLHYTVTKVGGAEHLHLLSESVSNTSQQLSLTGSYVARSLDLLKRRRQNLYSLLGDETGSHTAMWNHFSVPYSRTATTLYGANTILIPEGVMAPPLMYPALAALPNYLLYAGIGHLVAHEFLHAIDTTGIRFDAMSGVALDRPPHMDAQENCLVQYLNTNFSLPVQKTSFMSFRLPAHLHLNELMADSGATRLAWMAYIHGETAKAGKGMSFVTDAPSKRRRRSVPTTDSQERPLPWLDMTPYQLYLLRTAQTQCARTSDIDVIAIMEQEHLPARLRVNLAMINEPLFADAFKCPVGSTMRVPYTCPFVISHMPDE